MFLKKICDDKDITIVIITHDPRFLDYADYTYKVADGYVVSDHSPNVKGIEEIGYGGV